MIHEINWDMVDKEIKEVCENNTKRYVYSKEKQKEYSQRAYLKNKEAILARNAKYRKEHPKDKETLEKERLYALEYRKKRKEFIEQAKKMLGETLVKIIVENPQ
jgi:hypothetical protein